MTQKSNYNYSRILKSSSLIGGAQGINILMGMVRVKLVAMLIGPVGVGLVGTYQATIRLIGTIVGLGLQSSAVRDIAEANGNQDQERIGRIAVTLQRMCWLTGGSGTLIVAFLSSKISILTFSSPDFSVEIALVGLTILFATLQGGQMAMIQGMRRIGDLAKLNVVGVAIGSVISVGLYAWLGKQGIVPTIISLGITQLIASWWFSRKINVPKVTMSWRESFREAGGMMRLGLAFMWSGLLVAAVAYATRTLIAREIDLVAVGIFIAAFNLSGMVVNFVLGAMAADYYPSLTAVSSDNMRMRELVNQQTEIGLLLALPGLVGTLALAPWLIKIFYTADFSQAADLLRWFSLGCLGRVISWPMGFILLAKGASKLFTVTETISHLFHLGMIWVFLNWSGIEGVSEAFLLLYIFHTLLMLVVSRYLINFSWNAGVCKLLALTIPLIILTFVAGKVLSITHSTVIGLLLTVGISIFCLHGLISRLGPDHNLSRLIRSLPLMGRLIDPR